MRIFSRCFAAVVALVVMMALPGYCQQVVSTVSAVTTADSLVAIDWLAKVIAKANPQYPDPYKVPIGVLINVPTISGPQVFYKTEPWHLGQLGCFWHISAHHLFGKRMMPPDPVPVVVPMPPTALENFLDALQSFWNAIPWWILLLLAAAIAYGYYSRRERQLDARRDPPVIQGGLSPNPPRALEQVQEVLANRQDPDQPTAIAETAERGYLHSLTGRKSFVTRVQHGDGITRDKRLREGDQCYRVTISRGEGVEPEIQFWLSHCGNPCMIRKDGRFEMPDGWEFVPTAPAAIRPIENPAQTVAEEVHSRAAAHVNGHNGTTPEQFTSTIKLTMPDGQVTKLDIQGDRYATQAVLPDGTAITF